ncbi:MAG: hypothetical protein KatS3mg115_0174 [Candidatus Poribacteria bacterium]|nr:MAG: hypothetical protein KatS3mg115_0174 [Candidatus Poribacteria bacterium]
MPELKRIDLKFYAQNPEAIDYPALTEVFIRWSKEDPNRWLDIADYLHVPSGPGLLLIGNDYHIGVDNHKDRPGFLFSLREPLEGPTEERIAGALRLAIQIGADLEAEETIRVRFGVDPIEFIVNDRMYFPNEPEVYAALEGAIREGFRQVFSEVSVERHDDPKKRLGATIRTGDRRTLSQVREEIGQRL